MLLCGLGEPPVGDSNFPVSALTQNFNLIHNYASMSILSSHLVMIVVSVKLSAPTSAYYLEILCGTL